MKFARRFAAILIASFALVCAAFAQNFAGAAELDTTINQAVREDKIPVRCCWWGMTAKSFTGKLTDSALCFRRANP